MKKFLALLLFACSASIVFPQFNLNTDSLKQQLSLAKEDTSKLSILHHLWFVYVWANPDTAIIYARQQLLLAQKSKLLGWEAIAMGNYGYALNVMGNYSQALDFILQSLRQAKNVKDPKFLIYTYWYLGDVYRDQGDYIHAIKYAYKATEVSDSSTLEMAISLANVGSIYEKFNRLDSAIAITQKAYVLDSMINGKCTLSQAPYILGNIFSKKGNYPLALKYYYESISLAISQNILKDLMDIYNGMAKTFIKTKQTDSAIFYAQRTAAFSKATAYPLATLDAVSILSNIYQSQNLVDSTLKYMSLTIAIRDSLFNRQKITEVQNLSFNEQLRQLEIQEAQEELRNKIKIYSLLAVLIVLSIIGFILYRNNQQKQKAKIKIEKAYDELKSTQAQLIQSEKMASLGELTAGIAHEIQNPLNFVNNFSEVSNELVEELNEEVDKGNTEEVKAIANDIKQNLEKINHHGKRADAIVKGMLQHSSSSSSGVKEPTDINALADKYLRLAYHGLRAKDKSFNATMKTDFDESIGNINIIPQDIGRVILNLINNAFYAAPLPPEGGFKDPNYMHEPTVTVRTSRNPPSGGRGAKVLISVKDNGPGIPQKILDKIFQPFFTTKPTGQGTGLGLSLAYDIVKANGGELKVETQEGKGAEFIIQLPVT